MNKNTPPGNIYKDSVEPKTGRNSNIEFLRIVAMFMVLIMHADFGALGEPSTADSVSKPVTVFLRVAFEMFAIPGVDLFVLISGWFGITPTMKGLGKFIFQCVFIIGFVYVLGILTHQTYFSLGGLSDLLFMGTGGSWFITSYLALYILAPILNIFCQNTTENQFRWILIAFYLFQTLYGCFTLTAGYISSGYSAFSFIGLYLLARYLRLYGSQWLTKSRILYFSSLVISILWFYLPLRFGVLRVSYMSMHYTSPFIILSAIGLLLWGANKPFKTNRLINFFASSAFAVYLAHMCVTWAGDEYFEVAKNIFNDYRGMLYVVIMFCFMVSVYLAATVIDQLRKVCWKLLI